MEFLQSFSPVSLLAAGAAVILLIGGNWSKIKAALPKGGGSAGDPDVEAVIACRSLLARFTKLGCPEGIAAAKVCLSHLFDEHYPGT